MCTTTHIQIKVISIISVLFLILGGQKLISQEISTIGEIYDFEVGDEFHIHSYVISPYFEGNDDYYNDKVLDKYFSANSDTVYYVIEQKHKWFDSYYEEWYFNQDTILEYYTNLNELIFYGLIDTVYNDPDLYNGRLINFKVSIGGWNRYTFVEGLGLADYTTSDSEIEFNEYILYYKKGTEEWGTPYPLIPIDEMLTIGEVYDYEIGDLFHIESSSIDDDIEYYTLYNKEVIGKTFTSNNDTVTYEMAVKEMHISSEIPEPIYDYYVEEEVCNSLDDPINDTEIDSIYVSLSLYNGRMINSWNKGDSSSYLIIHRFVEGCGEVFFHNAWWIGYEYTENKNELLYYNKGGEEWGTPNIVVSTEENYAIANSIQFYPNPTRDYITIKNNKAGSGELEILSLTGKTIKRISFVNNQEINISDMKSGIYILRIEMDGRQTFKKLIKE